MKDEVRQPRFREFRHAIVWLLSVALATVAYVFAHRELECYYIEDIRPQVQDAVHWYGVRPDKHTGVLELHVGATAHDPESYARGPLGIGDLPEVRGVLHRASAVVEEYNADMRKYVEAQRSGFFRSPHNPHFMATVAKPAESQCDVEGLDDLDKEGRPAQYRFRVPADSFTRILQEYPNEQTLDALIDLMTAAQPMCVVEGHGVGLWGDGRKAVKKVVHKMRQRREKLRSDVDELFDADSSNMWESAFHRDLREVVERNAGFFWTSGDLFWYEMMLLAVLGVLTRQLVLLAKTYTGKGRASAWRPRESMRTLMYLAVAPIFSLVIIWILSATNLVAVKPVIGDDWSNATVPIAFLLGLFPTLGYDVLRGLAKGLFNRNFKDDDRAARRPANIPAMPTDTQDDRRPSIGRLRQRIRRHATAVFR